MVEGVDDGCKIFTHVSLQIPLAVDEILVKLSEETEFGIILRAKGMLPAADGTWLYFDLVPGEYEIRNGAPDYTGRLCVIGSKMDTDKLEKLFKL